MPAPAASTEPMRKVERHDRVDLHAHEAGHLGVLGDRAHRPSPASASDELVQEQHEAQRCGEDQDLEVREHGARRRGRAASRRAAGNALGRVPTISMAAFWRNRETPRAAMRGPRRLVPRTGR